MNFFMPLEKVWNALFGYFSRVKSSFRKDLLVQPVFKVITRTLGVKKKEC